MMSCTPLSGDSKADLQVVELVLKHGQQVGDIDTLAASAQPGVDILVDVRLVHNLLLQPEAMCSITASYSGIKCLQELGDTQKAYTD